MMWLAILLIRTAAWPALIEGGSPPGLHRKLNQSSSSFIASSILSQTIGSFSLPRSSTIQSIYWLSLTSRVSLSHMTAPRSSRWCALLLPPLFLYINVLWAPSTPSFLLRNPTPRWPHLLSQVQSAEESWKTPHREIGRGITQSISTNPPICFLSSMEISVFVIWHS